MPIHYNVENHIAEITIDRQEVRNAMDLVTIKELGRLFLDIRDNSEIWVVIITGAGKKAFCSGADIAKLPAQLMEAGESLIEAGYKNIMFGFEVYKPIIAAVNGLCLGGGFELAMSCDFRIASENANFGLVEPKIGAIPSAGGTQRLTRLVPLGIALEMLMTAKRIDAEEACRIGLVNRVVPFDELMPTVRQIAEQICANAPLAVRGVKEAALKGQQLSIRDGLALEADIAERVNKSEDIQEGFTAFLEKRKPEWKGR